MINLARERRTLAILRRVSAILFFVLGGALVGLQSIIAFRTEPPPTPMEFNCGVPPWLYWMFLGTVWVVMVTSLFGMAVSIWRQHVLAREHARLMKQLDEASAPWRLR